jgi:hypothetical protein
MKINLKTLLLWFVPVGMACAVLQRPLRDPEFVNGLLGSLYPWLWLCYSEDLVTHDPSGGGAAGCAGVMVGMFVQISAAVLGPAFIAGCVAHWRERKLVQK